MYMYLGIGLIATINRECDDEEINRQRAGLSESRHLFTKQMHPVDELQEFSRKTDGSTKPFFFSYNILLPCCLLHVVSC